MISPKSSVEAAAPVMQRLSPISRVEAAESSYISLEEAKSAVV